MVKKLRILSLINETHKATWKRTTATWDKYFEFENIIDHPSNIEKYLKKNIDILFMQSHKQFENQYYQMFSKNNQNFTYVVILNKPSPKDGEVYKKLADRIIYSGLGDDYLKWATIASLRRYWATHSKSSTIIYKNIIADFAENKFSINNKNIRLTTKEVDLLRYFFKNKDSYISKERIFVDVWGYDGVDTSRSLDQMIFKLKKKIGKEYFSIVRGRGIKFS